MINNKLWLNGRALGIAPTTCSIVNGPSVRTEGVQIEQNKKFLSSTFIWKSTSIAALCVAAFFGIINSQHQEKVIEPTSSETMFVMNSDTDLYELNPETNDHLKGYAWVNNRTEELYLFVDGLIPIKNKDYQAWVKTNNGLHDAGILQLLDRSGQLYLKNKPIDDAEYIIVSIEPKGGSRSPTKQDSYFIRFDAR